MKWICAVFAIIAFTFPAQGALKLGDSLTPYEIKNTRTNAIYCQICAYGSKAAKVVAFGSLNDASFWSDLEKLQALATQYPKLGVFAQILDSEDSKAIQVAATKHGIKFPIVTAVEKNWDDAYQVQGVSRTLYYAAKNNEILWTTVGLDEAADKKLAEKLRIDLAG